MGNGYDGYSMSNNAREAYDLGKMPISKWTKRDVLGVVKQELPDKVELVSQLTLPLIKKYLLTSTEWHHTSSYYNSTDFYEVDLDFIGRLTQDDIDRWTTKNSQQKQDIDNTTNRFLGRIDYIEWGGTRSHPTAKNKQLDNVFIEQRGSFYYVYDNNDNLLLKKKVDSRGTYVTNLQERAKLKAQVSDYRQRREKEIIENSPENAVDFYMTSAEQYGRMDVSQSGYLYIPGRKPKPWDYDDISNFSEVGERRLAPNGKGYILEKWDGTKFVPQV